MKAAFLILALTVATGCTALQRPEELAWQGLHVVDMAQTVDGMRDSCVQESNPLTRAMIGEHPSTGRIVGYGIASSAVHAGVSDLLLTNGWSKTYKVWQAVSIADTGISIGVTWANGVRLGAPNKTGCAQ
jgi:hypothetical protein